MDSDNWISLNEIATYLGVSRETIYKLSFGDKNSGNMNVVGKKAEDLSRHDKWLCMMYPKFDGLNVVYGTGCMTLRAAQIDFKQIPYERKR